METGLTYTSTVTVSEENIAATMGSGDLEVFCYAGYGGIDGKCGNECRSRRIT